MKANTLPIPLARAAMMVMPSAFLARAVQVVVKRMERRHPKLFINMGRLDPALVHLEPTDLPHRFGLRMGQGQVAFYVVQDEVEQPDARVAGSLEALIDMLEGREDGDALFFSRDIQVTGNTTIIVGLRNTLDREEINLYDEVISLCGPFAGAAGVALSLADHVAKRIKARLAAVHDEMHRKREEEAAS